MSEAKVTPKEIDDFAGALQSIDLSIRTFCDRAAAEEYNLTEKEIVSKSEAYRKRFTRKSITKFEFNIMQDILIQQPEYIKSNSIYLARKKNVFQDKDFEKSLLSSFKVLHSN